jgi:hypothetical protein
VEALSGVGGGIARILTLQFQFALFNLDFSLCIVPLENTGFRKSQGFPLGEVDDILALSDLPYFTACPRSVSQPISLCRQGRP